MSFVRLFWAGLKFVVVRVAVVTLIGWAAVYWFTGDANPQSRAKDAMRAQEALSQVGRALGR